MVLTSSSCLLGTHLPSRCLAQRGAHSSPSYQVDIPGSFYQMFPFFKSVFLYSKHQGLALPQVPKGLLHFRDFLGSDFTPLHGMGSVWGSEIPRGLADVGKNLLKLVSLMFLKGSAACGGAPPPSRLPLDRQCSPGCKFSRPCPLPLSSSFSQRTVCSGSPTLCHGVPSQ